MQDTFLGYLLNDWTFSVKAMLALTSCPDLSGQSEGNPLKIDCVRAAVCDYKITNFILRALQGRVWKKKQLNHFADDICKDRLLLAMEYESKS